MKKTVDWTAERQRFRAVTETTNLIAWATDLNGECFYLSPEWFHFTGADADQGIGLSWLSLVHPDDAGKVRRSFLHAHDTQTAYGAAFRLARADGDYSSVWAVGLPKFGENDQFEGFYGTVCPIQDYQEEEPREEEPQPRGKYAITEREREILRLISFGNTSDTVASMLGITSRTVDTHIANAGAKLGTFNRVHAVATALRKNQI
ncbi:MULTISPECIES: PAS domain-containing protein [unclassified Devosia]|uniref:PAS domain-containing protein n=1 Tax=unclassified Devosia TaxID=196773 RepID=UPI000714DCD7|nr:MULTISPECIES: LuxR C-terminal-related transcriptional regulator [unclassified Devosia]KQT47244.1 hypothetical protein ASG47_11760 [Devosia sp. Leaf420]